MKQSHRIYGFTLIEMMAALAVSAILILTCGVMMRTAEEDRAALASGIAWEREADRISEVLRGDLSTAHGEHWHEDMGEGVCEVGWLTLKSMRAQSGSKAVGDLCAVGYRLVDRKVGADRVQRTLLRQQLDSATVFEAIMADAMESLWTMTSEAEPLAGGVLLFEIWPLLRDGSESWQPWYSVLNAMPQAVELRLVLASPELQKRLKSSEDWDAAIWDLGQFDGDEVHELRNIIPIGRHAR